MAVVLRLMVIMALVVTGVMVGGCASDEVPSPGTQESSRAPSPGTQESSQAPDFRLPGLDGEEVSLSDFRGRPVLLNFWATWCGPCRIEMPFLQEVFEDEKWIDQGLVVLAVNLGESPGAVSQFVDDYGLSFPVVLDVNLEAAGHYNIRAIPATYFIDKNGIMIDRQIGTFASKEDIDWRLINSILNEE